MNTSIRGVKALGAKFLEKSFSAYLTEAGGSGAGKTRGFVKPSIMQMHSSYVVTDPKGTIVLELGKMLQKGSYVFYDRLNTIIL